MIRPGDVEIPRIHFNASTHYRLLDLIEKRVTPGPPGWARDGDGRLRVRCACGYWMACTNHTVDDDGTMFASWLHPSNDALNCGYHIMARLMDWDRLGQQAHTGDVWLKWEALKEAVKIVPKPPK